MPESSASETSALRLGRPLCVDLDGTLLRTDTTQERLILFLKGRESQMWRLPLWLREGRPRTKAELASRTTLSPDLLPVSTEFLEFLRGERALGRRLVLVTGADTDTARQLGQYFGIFDEVLASDREINLISEQKRRRLVERFGEKGFDYAGNSHADLRVWDSANEAILVNTSAGVARQARCRALVVRIFNRTASPWTGLIRAMCPRCWLANLLVFVPVLAVGAERATAVLGDSILAFLAFCCITSSVRILTGLFDLESARRDPRRRYSPFASGQTPLAMGMLAVPLLLTFGFGISVWLPRLFFIYLLGCHGFALAYASLAKKSALSDILVGFGLLAVRVFAGEAATGILCPGSLLGVGGALLLGFAVLKQRLEARRSQA